MFSMGGAAGRKRPVHINPPSPKTNLKKEQKPMRAIIETVFDIFYLAAVLTVGIRMIRGSKSGSQFKLFGLMAVVLGAGDSFHLVPRALALCTTGLENYAVPLGLGK
jgi:hypothetical protein